MSAYYAKKEQNEISSQRRKKLKIIKSTKIAAAAAAKQPFNMKRFCISTAAKNENILKQKIYCATQELLILVSLYSGRKELQISNYIICFKLY